MASHDQLLPVGAAQQQSLACQMRAQPTLALADRQPQPLLTMPGCCAHAMWLHLAGSSTACRTLAALSSSCKMVLLPAGLLYASHLKVSALPFKPHIYLRSDFTSVHIGALLASGGRLYEPAVMLVGQRMLLHHAACACCCTMLRAHAAAPHCCTMQCGDHAAPRCTSTTAGTRARCMQD